MDTEKSTSYIANHVEEQSNSSNEEITWTEAEETAIRHKLDWQTVPVCASTSNRIPILTSIDCNVDVFVVFLGQVCTATMSGFFRVTTYAKTERTLAMHEFKVWPKTYIWSDTGLIG